MIFIHFIRLTTTEDYSGTKPSKTEKVTVLGILDILKGRGLYKEKDRAGKRIVLNCKKKKGELTTFLDGSRNDYCCHMHKLASQSDFLEQQSGLFEKVKGKSHIVNFYPKFHCECNFIERYWSACKREARRNCSYSYAKLKANLPRYMDSIPYPEVKFIFIQV